jgi:hypothetical protein
VGKNSSDYSALQFDGQSHDHQRNKVGFVSRVLAAANHYQNTNKFSDRRANPLKSSEFESNSRTNSLAYRGANCKPDGLSFRTTFELPI